MSRTTTVELDSSLSLDVRWRPEGHYHPASEYSRAERPVPVIERAVIKLGEFEGVASFAQLPEDVQELVLSELQDEIDSDAQESY